MKKMTAIIGLLSISLTALATSQSIVSQLSPRDPGDIVTAAKNLDKAIATSFDNSTEACAIFSTIQTNLSGIIVAYGRDIRIESAFAKVAVAISKAQGACLEERVAGRRMLISRDLTEAGAAFLELDKEIGF